MVRKFILKKHKFANYKIIVIGILLGFLYWYVESLIHYFLMGDGHDPLSHLLHLDPQDIWMRAFFIFLIVIISIIIQNSINKDKNYRIILIGILLTTCFWIIEAILHTIIFNLETNFINNLFFPPAHEFWMRIIVLFILLIFSVLSQNMINQIHDMHKKLQIVENELRKSYNNSKFYKDLFTHDVNNILSVINSSATLLSDYYKNPNKVINIEEYPELIQDQIMRGSKLIKNVQNLFELEETERPIQKLEAISFLNQAIHYVKKAYKDKTIEIQVEFLDEKFNIHANELVLDIFENILINAIKHNKNPIIEVFIRISKEYRDGNEFVKLEFIDNGLGIADEKKKVIFEKDSRSYKVNKGMGLGLSLVKKIMDSYFGYIWVENRVQEDYTKGSNFVILIPKAS
ncbi:MAG: sensor histidine kinase [Promethearchaeota archaeon]|jgi:signal transduction histidine kinase